MKRRFLISLPSVLLTLLLISLGPLAKAQNTISDKTGVYVSSCVEDFSLSGSVKKVKVTSYRYKDGEKATLPISDLLCSFDMNGNCLSVLSNDYSFNIPTHRMIEYSYDSLGNVVSEKYTENGEPQGSKRFQYNPFKETTYNEDDEIEDIILLEKNGTYSNLGFNGTITEKNLNPRGAILSQSIDYYKDGTIIKNEYSISNNSNTTVYSYDTEGHMILSKTTDSDGQITRKEVNTYSDGVLESTELYLLYSTLDLTKAWRYDSRGREIYFCSYMVVPDPLITYYFYEDDSHGNWEKLWIRDQNNIIVEIIEREIEYY